MTSEQWQQIKTIVQQSLETEPEKRARFVAEKCGDDASLRNEVGALLAINESIGDFIETPAYLQVMETLPIEEPARSSHRGRGSGTMRSSGNWDAAAWVRSILPRTTSLVAKSP